MNFFFEQIAGAIQTQTKSVRKLQTIRNIICVRGGKLGKLTPPHPPGKSDPFRGGGMDIFWNHKIAGLTQGKGSVFPFINGIVLKKSTCRQ